MLRGSLTTTDSGSQTKAKEQIQTLVLTTTALDESFYKPSVDELAFLRGTLGLDEGLTKKHVLDIQRQYVLRTSRSSISFCYSLLDNLPDPQSLVSRNTNQDLYKIHKRIVKPFLTLVSDFSHS